MWVVISISYGNNDVSEDRMSRKRLRIITDCFDRM